MSSYLGRAQDDRNYTNQEIDSAIASVSVPFNFQLDFANAAKVSTGTSSAYTIPLAIPPASYINGQVFVFIPHVTNVANATLNFGAGAVQIARADGSNAQGSEIIAGIPARVAFHQSTNRFRAIDSEFLKRDGNENLTSLTANTVTANNLVANNVTLLANTNANNFSVSNLFSSNTANTVSLNVSNTATIGTLAVSNTASFANNVTVQAPVANNNPATREYVDVRFNAGFNKLINTGFFIDQRGNSASVQIPNGGGTWTYVVDRWAGTRVNSAIPTLSRNYSAEMGGYFLRCQVNAAASLGTSDLIVPFRQMIEGFLLAEMFPGTASATSLTLSFRFRSSVTGNYCVAFRNSALNRYRIAQFNYTTANTPQDVNITIPMDTSGTWNLNNLGGLEISIGNIGGSGATGVLNAWTTSGAIIGPSVVNWANTANAFVDMSMPRLVIGSVPMPFDLRPPSIEQALCARYFQTIENVLLYRTTNNGTYGGGVVNVTYPTMRGPPTRTMIVTGGNYNDQTGIATTNSLTVWFNTFNVVGDWCSYRVLLDAEI